METLLESTPVRIPFHAFRPLTDQDVQGPAPRRGLPDYFLAPDNRILEAALAELMLPQPARRRLNPLVFHGPSGIGKTHLALGLASCLDSRSHSPHHSGQVTTGADWARAHARALEEGWVVRWRDICRQTHYFVLDDVHQLHRKFAAQRELLSLLDDLVGIDVPCILTCRMNPLAASELIPELAGRLAGGLTIPLHPPDRSTRRAYLEQLAVEHGLEITHAGLELLADAIVGTVPEVRAAFWQLARGMAVDRRIDVLEIRRVMRDQLTQESPLPVSAVVAAVARYFQLSKSKLTGATRRHSVAQARCIAIYLARQLTRATLKSIGAYFGGRDHTTVLHAFRKIEELLETDPATQTAVETITRQLTKGRTSFRT